MLNPDTVVPAQPDAKLERIRYDGFRAYLMGRAPTESLADAFARQIVARGHQSQYGYPADEGMRRIAQDLHHWVIKPRAAEPHATGAGEQPPRGGPDVGR